MNFFCIIILSISYIFIVVCHPADAAPAQPAGQHGSVRQDGDALRSRATRQGMSIELSLEPAAGDAGSKHVVEGEYTNLNITIRDDASGSPLKSLYPAVWVDQRKEFKGEKNKQELSCNDKIRSYLKGGLSYRPDIDLNSYYILSLNNDATISVIDPIMGVAGFSQMFKMILLKSAGADWVASRDEKTLFVTMPKAGRIALVDMEQFTVRGDLPAGEMPARIVTQPDNRYLWVGNDAAGSAGGVTVLDAVRGTQVISIATAPGRHDIALTDDSLYALVMNRDAGTVTIIDTQKLQKVKELRTGPNPTAVAFSAMSKAAYVIDETAGTITVIDGTSLEIMRVIKEEPGIAKISFAPGGRWGFILNRLTNKALILDASANTVNYREAVGLDPEQVTFSSSFAYVRSRGTAEVTLLALDSIGKGDKITALKVSGGSRSPSESTYYPSGADSISVTPEGNSVVIASPSDATIIYYVEGMSVPMGSFNNSGRIPRALKTLNRSLRETRPGVYSARIKVPRSGIYDVMFLLDSPRITECFSFQADVNPALAKMKTGRPVHLEFLTTEREVKVGAVAMVRVRILDEATGVPLSSPVELTALPTLAPSGNWQERYSARPVGNGVYEFSFVPPSAGMYNVYFSLAGMKLGFVQLPYLILKAVAK